jgi:hypothetical protein
MRGHSALSGSIALSLLLAVPGSPWSFVYLNEITIRGVEKVELYNASPDSVNLDGWRIRGDLGDYVIADSVIAPGGYMVFMDLGDIFDNLGGETALIDLNRGVRDSVRYGNRGGAPLPHDDADPRVSLCRAPDASVQPPTGDFARDWTLDFDETFGGMNDAPPPALGVSLVINEVRVGGAREGATEVELYNPHPSDQNTDGWQMTFGEGPALPLGGTIPFGGFGLYAAPPADDPVQSELVYLFDYNGVRVDQVGWYGSGVEPGGCIGRCPDGEGPNDGYDFPSSGGGMNWLLVTCSLGAPNTCPPTQVEPTATSWGRLKLRYRDR